MREPVAKVAVLGAGSFGTALADHLARLPPHRVKQVMIYGRSEANIAAINQEHVNVGKLPDHTLSEGVVATTSVREALESAQLVVLAIPAQHLRGFLEDLSSELNPKTELLNLAKGIEKGSLKRMSQVIREVCPKQPVATLTGPSFAKDIVRQKPVGLTLAATNGKMAKRLQWLLTTTQFDVKRSGDLAGIELGGAMKNVFAIVAGIFAGCNMGSSITGDYFSRSLVEMRDVGMYLGGRWATFGGRSGLGDLAITCTNSSRNFRFGRGYVEHYDPAETATEAYHDQVFQQTIDALGTRTVEGHDTLAPLYHIVDRKKMFTPIVRSVYRVLHARDLSPHDLLREIRRLDLRRPKEGSGLFSIIMHEALPKLWYRRRRPGPSPEDDWQ